MLKLTDVLAALEGVDTRLVHYRTRMQTPVTVWAETEMRSANRSNSRAHTIVGGVNVVHYAKPQDGIDQTAWQILHALLAIGCECRMVPQYNPETDEMEYVITVEEVVIDGPIGE